jgi:hypothetical protein
MGNQLLAKFHFVPNNYQMVKDVHKIKIVKVMIVKRVYVKDIHVVIIKSAHQVNVDLNIVI